MKLPGLQSDVARSVAILALGTFAVGTDAFILSAFLPEMAAELGVSVAHAGYAVTVFAASYAVLSPILATLTVRFERRKLLISAIVALVLTDIAAALAASFETVLASRIFAAMAASLAPLESRGRALSVVVGGMTIATAIGVPLGNLASNALSWRGALFMVAAVGVLAAIGIFFRLPPMPGLCWLFWTIWASVHRTCRLCCFCTALARWLEILYVARPLIAGIRVPYCFGPLHSWRWGLP